jgi:hypothetical protein
VVRIHQGRDREWFVDDTQVEPDDIEPDAKESAEDGLRAAVTPRRDVWDAPESLTVERQRPIPGTPEAGEPVMTGKPLPLGYLNHRRIKVI